MHQNKACDLKSRHVNLFFCLLIHTHISDNIGQRIQSPYDICHNFRSLLKDYLQGFTAKSIQKQVNLFLDDTITRNTVLGTLVEVNKCLLATKWCAWNIIKNRFGRLCHRDVIILMQHALIAVVVVTPLAGKGLFTPKERNS